MDFAGHPVALDEIRTLAKKKNLVVIEDACHALGASYKGHKLGGISDMTVFSFHPVKSITTGEGGAVLTTEKKFYEKLRRFRHHGITKEGLKRSGYGPWYYEVQDLGTNGRLTDFQCALGLSQLKKLDRFVQARQRLANRYREAFKSWSDIRMVLPDSKDQSAWHLAVILLQGDLFKKRDTIMQKLQQNGVGTQVHYGPVHHHPYYEQLGYSERLCSNASDFSARAISLPLYPTLSDADQDTVIAQLKAVLSEVHEGSYSR